jgi:hypothetical protein
MTWEMLRRGRWSLPTAALGANALPLLLFTVLQHDGALDPTEKSQIMMHIVVVQINVLFFGIFVFGAIGAPARLYALPIRTSSLVALLLLQGMLAVAAELVLSTMLLNAAFGLGWPLLGWPLLGPALFGAVAASTILAMLWFTEKSAWIFVAIGLAGSVLGLWLKSHYGPMFSPPSHYWAVVTPVDALTLILATLLAYWIGVAGVSRNRCGEPPLSVGLIAWFERVFAATPQDGLAFRTPADAQFWFEWRTKGPALPAMVIMGLVMGFGIWLIGIRESKALYEGLVSGGALLVLGGFLGGFVFGNLGRPDSHLQIGHFLATRPISTTEIARSVLKCAAKGLLIAWTIWAVAFFALYALLWSLGVGFMLSMPAPLGWWYLPATLVGAWAAMGVLTPVALAGRQTLAAVLIFGSVALFVGLLLLSKYALSREGQEQFFQGSLVACGIALMLGTAWAFSAARRRSLIGGPTLIVASVVWVALCTLVALQRLSSLGTSHPAERLPLYIAAVGILALAVSPLATAPLALAWNRNR